MDEIRGDSAVALTAALGVLVLIGVGLGVRYVTRQPEVAANLPPLFNRFFLASLILALATMMGLLVYTLVWGFET